jgi:hypothetical protein
MSISFDCRAANGNADWLPRRSRPNRVQLDGVPALGSSGSPLYARRIVHPVHEQPHLCARFITGKAYLGTFDAKFKLLKRIANISDLQGSQGSNVDGMDPG